MIRTKERVSTSDIPDELYRMLVQGVTDYAIYMLDRDGLVTSWNAGAERAKGYCKENILGRHFSLFYTPEDQAAGLPQDALSIALARGKYEARGWRVRRDGSRFWANVVIEAIYQEPEGFIGFAKVTRDLTNQKLQEDRLVEARATLDLALSNMSQGLSLFGPDERLLLCNDRFRAMYGLSEEEVPIGTSYDRILERVFDTPERWEQDIAELIRFTRERHARAMAQAGQTLVLEMSLNGRILSVSRRALPDGGWVSTTDDITERRHSESRIRHLAHLDALTGLSNRAAFRDLLERTLADPAVGTASALLYIDLDRFKPINDTWGHPVGDAVLEVVARRITAELRTTDNSSRLGGDEFTALLDGCTDRAEACSIAERLIGAIACPITVHGIEVTVGASVGIALAPRDGADPDMLLRNADLALHKAKDAGRNCVRLYEAGMESNLERRAAMERSLRSALNQGEFVLHYQPVVSASLGQVVSFEALLRWQSPTRGNVSPAEFIPFAEQIGLMAEIDDWVLSSACSEAATWPAHVGLAVNLSATRLKRSDLSWRMARILEETGLAAERLEIEITETAMIEDVDQAAGVLRELRAIGIGIALDDFGTGYSSLSFLLSLPFTRIKVDRSFVRDLGSKPEALAIVRAVVGLCRTLGVSMTAEGVETLQQLNILRAECCPEIQGYLIARPVPCGQLHRWTTIDTLPEELEALVA